MSGRVHPVSEFVVPLSCWDWLLDWLCCHRLLHRTTLTADERAELDRLVERTSEPKDEVILAQMLRRLWRSVAETAYPEPPSQAWKRLGFQGLNPTTDVRAGLFAVRQLDYFVAKYPRELGRLVREAQEAEHYYSFAIVAFNVSFMITRYFRVTPGVDPTGQGRQATREELKSFAKKLDGNFIDDLFVATLIATHDTWRKMETKNLLNFSECLQTALLRVMAFIDSYNWAIISPTFAQLIAPS